VDASAAAERLKALARAAGFDLAGVAALGPAATGRPTGAGWRRRPGRDGLDGAQCRAARDRAACCRGPQRAGRGAALRAARGIRRAAAGDLWPRVARYARGRDYHDLIRGGLERVAAEAARLFPGIASRVCVDTAPLLERELAARAGLGAVGKNTNLLHPESLLVPARRAAADARPATGSPLADLCGDCSRCLDACRPCPARTVAPGRPRCLSYWTIEHRGPVARASARARRVGVRLRRLQEACPGTGARRPSTIPSWAAAGAPQARPGRLLGLAEEDFRSLFRAADEAGTRGGLRRNAALALAGTADERARGALESAAEGDPSPVVRERRRGLRRPAGTGR